MKFKTVVSWVQLLTNNDPALFNNLKMYIKEKAVGK